MLLFSLAPFYCLHIYSLPNFGLRFCFTEEIFAQKHLSQQYTDSPTLLHAFYFVNINNAGRNEIAERKIRLTGLRGLHWWLLATIKTVEFTHDVVKFTTRSTVQSGAAVKMMKNDRNGARSRGLRRKSCCHKVQIGPTSIIALSIDRNGRLNWSGWANLAWKLIGTKQNVAGYVHDRLELGRRV